MGRDGRVIVMEPSTALDPAAPFVEVIVGGLAGLGRASAPVPTKDTRAVATTPSAAASRKTR